MTEKEKSGKIRLSAETKTQLLLVLALAVGSAIVLRNFILGNEIMVFNDIGEDTWHQYTMNYVGFVNRLRDGTLSTWDFTNGFGSSIFNLNIFDPSLMLLYAVGYVLGPAHMMIFLAPIHALRIIAAGWIFYRFLSQHRFSRQAKFVMAFAYGFNGYLMVWGQHYQFGMVTVYLPLMLLFAEKFIKGTKGRRFFPVTVFLCSIYSVYFTYMCMITVGFYLLFRVMMEKDTSMKRRIKKFLAGCIQMLLGLGMGFVIFLPLASVMMNVSSRIGGEGMNLWEQIRHCFRFYDPELYVSELMRMFSNNLTHAHGLADGKFEGFSNYYEDPVLFCSTLSVFLNVQFLIIYWKNRISDKREKRIIGAAVVFVILSTVLELAGMVFNALQYPIHRYTFVLIPFFLLISAWVWDYIKAEGKISYFGVAATFGVMLFVYLVGYEQSVFPEHRRNIIILIATGTVMALCLAGTRLLKKSGCRELLMGVMALALIVNVISESGANFDCRMTLRKSDTPLEEMDEAKEIYFRDRESSDQELAARTAMTKVPQNYFRELYRQDIQDALDFLEEYDSEFYRVEKDFSSVSYSMDSVAQGYRGISTYNSVMNGNIKEFIIKLYPSLFIRDQNHYTYWDNAEDNWLGAFTGVRYLLSGKDNLDSSEYKLLKQVGSIFVYENVMESDMARFYENAISEESLKKICNKKNRPELLLNGAIAIEGGKEISDIDELEKPTEAQADSTVTLDAPVRDSLVTGTIHAQTDGYVMFMIPFEKGWELTIDGEKTEMRRADYGFIACTVTAGDHEVVLSYHVPWLKEGAVLSAIFAGIYLLWSLISIFRELSQSQSV